MLRDLSARIFLFLGAQYCDPIWVAGTDATSNPFPLDCGGPHRFPFPSTNTTFLGAKKHA
jgi:hypothetical protein